MDTRALSCPVPEGFLARLRTQLGQEEYAQFLDSFSRPRAAALRLNPAKPAPQSLPFLRERVPWEATGYYYDPAAHPARLPYHDAGVYYLQEASAMAPAALLAPEPGERVLDLCAAPGGKSTQLAGKLNGKGLLVCNEVNAARAKVLSQNVERMGIGNALVLNESASHLATRLPDFFDRVLVDAPCSGEGMFRKEPAAAADWSEARVSGCAERQRAILADAAKLVRPGGRLVYSTCTFAPEENEQTVQYFLDGHPNFAPESIDAPYFTAGENGSFRLWPHKLRGEGHFAAVLRRLDGKENALPCEHGAALPAQWRRFAEGQGITLPEGATLLFGQTLYWIPPDTPQLAGLRVLRAGLALGTLKPDRLEPAHALALWLKPRSGDLRYTADAPQLRAYLRGETIPAAERGWRLLCVENYPLGWVKGDGTALKNHYPKGLRHFP